MFTKIWGFIKGFFLGIFPNFDWKKFLWALAAGVVTYLLFAFVIRYIFTMQIVYVAGAVAVGYLVYTRVAMWEIQKLLDQAKELVK